MRIDRGGWPRSLLFFAWNEIEGRARESHGKYETNDKRPSTTAIDWFGCFFSIAFHVIISHHKMGYHRFIINDDVAIQFYARSVSHSHSPSQVRARVCVILSFPLTNDSVQSLHQHINGTATQRNATNDDCLIMLSLDRIALGEPSTFVYTCRLLLPNRLGEVQIYSKLAADPCLTGFRLTSLVISRQSSWSQTETSLRAQCIQMRSKVMSLERRIDMFRLRFFFFLLWCRSTTKVDDSVGGDGVYLVTGDMNLS